MTAPIRSRLLAGTAALGLLLLAEAASAQAFDGTPITVHGSVSRFTEPGKETIVVETPSAVVNWIPNSNADTSPFDFLPAGNVATFQNSGQNENFTILNRIVPDNNRPMAFNGTVISRLVSNSGSVPGGTVVFYTPGGILIGGTAVFDVGNLLLTTIDPVIDPKGNFFVGNSYQLSDPKLVSNSFVRIQPGARISALGAGSYVAAAAPIIQQGGSVRVNGSVAYVAAEAVNLTIDDGLFDIQVKVGSSSAPATIDHRGSTGGPASDGFGDNQIVYMVAVPKNDAVSLLLRGNVGYDVAANAAEVNGAIILSAGYDVALVAPDSASPVEAGIDIRQANVTSNLIGFATGDAVGTAFLGEVLNFAGDVTLVAPEAALGSENGVLRVGGNAVVTTGRARDFGFNSATGGQASLFARGAGTVQVAGSARVGASTLSAAGESAAGGDAVVSADGGSIFIGGALRIEAEAEAGSDGLADPGGATGGIARLAALNGGRVRVVGATEVTASATGAAGFGIGDGRPGTAHGGSASVAALSGQIDLASLTVTASGQGGPAFAGTGGAAIGGDSRVQAAAGGRVTVAGLARIESNGTGGTGTSETPQLPNVSGGSGTGGTARVLADGGIVQHGSLEGEAIGTGGARTGNGTSAGSGAGGLVELSVGGGGGLAAGVSLLRAFGTAGAGPNATGTGGNVVATGGGAGITGSRLVAEAGVDATLGGVRMTQLVDVTAQRRIAVTGRVEAETVSLASRDIEIATNGDIGAGSLAAFRVLPTGLRTVIGGTAAGPGYTLDRNELGRVAGARIRVTVPAPDSGPAQSPEVTVDSLTLAANVQPDPFTFEIATPGTIRVVGDVLLSGAGAGDGLSLAAGQRLEAITPTGSLRVLDSAGNPSGSLSVASSNIVVADPALAAQLAADPGFAGRNLALLLNPAPPAPRGYVEAGGIHFIVTQPQGNGPPGTLFVQNTGANFADLAGVTVGSGGLRISPVGLATVQGFGRRLNADGSFTTGDSFFQLAVFDRSAGAFTDDSELNLCKINGGPCPARLPAGVRPALSRTVLGPLLPSEAEPRDGLIDASGLAEIPLIDEPVISGGDSSLWDEDEEEEE